MASFLEPNLYLHVFRVCVLFTEDLDHLHDLLARQNVRRSRQSAHKIHLFFEFWVVMDVGTWFERHFLKDVRSGVVYQSRHEVLSIVNVSHK